MYLRPLQPVGDLQVHLSGDVTVDPSAILAPGVILRAAANSKIVVKAGVCIGSGTVIHACKGVIEIGCSASLGVGVLIVGVGKIGANACIGAATTIFNASVKEMQVIQAGSLLGDPSRQAPIDSGLQDTEEDDSHGDDLEDENKSETATEEEPKLAEQNGKSEVKPKSQAYIYGQMQVQQILGTILPHRQSLNNNSEDNS
ncbi:MAG: hypothetical protein WA865_11600 [Spirulinaceae cyanobacterium]